MDNETRAVVERNLKFVAVHLGAGSCQRELESVGLARQICEEVMLGSSSLQRPKRQISPKRSCDNNEPPKNAEEAVVMLVRKMEDNRLLNCGFGSNLNMRGQVECDASLMSDRTEHWAGVGAVSGCKNPILLAKSIFDQQQNPRPMGLIQPILIVGPGAKHWMLQHCAELIIPSSKLISSKSLSTYQRLKARYDAIVKSPKESNTPDKSMTPKKTTPVHTVSKNSPQTSRKADNHDLSLAQEKLQEDPKSLMRPDTVGAVAVDNEGNFAAAISSGGLMLKYSGRVGQAALPGAGCWAENSTAVTTTGVGEYLTLNLFAKKCNDKISKRRLENLMKSHNNQQDMEELIKCAINDCFQDLFRSFALQHVPVEERLAGLLAVSTPNPKGLGLEVHDLYLTVAHNTSSMCIGCMASCDSSASSFVSRRDKDECDELVAETIKISV